MELAILLIGLFLFVVLALLIERLFARLIFGRSSGKSNYDTNQVPVENYWDKVNRESDIYYKDRLSQHYLAKEIKDSNRRKY